ncbi:hypothetical protein HYFRA_00004736 [Hymenoscyphus fraxineus]|uniref:RelA/SpoT domain-containing protein n=1 Tax=Hymenoscyphus fraxineus TaxID=746836 RepID=A0A9N9KXD8_9HELO|nr:hypothetical protein HYFRA_00004736 [Hymenoscyphus fraxineus]
MTSIAPSISSSIPESDFGNDAIASFITDWVQIKYFYEKAASLAHELCETLLASNGIRAIVTHRVKQGNRLEAKLRERVRSQRKNYRSSLQIRDEIVDLAGVRIALYFPSDAEKIKNIMHEAFADVNHKPFPEEEEKEMSTISTPSSYGTSFAFKQRFEGYRADHYRVKMRIDNLSTKKQREDFQASNPVIEIQVASVLMHAWAEIDHDLVYKTLTSGPASREERRLLDATNGLVHTGEVLLQQLQTAMDTRVKYQKEPFRDKFELQHFLRTQVKAPRASTEHLDILFFVLKATNLNSPWKLGEKLEGFVIPSGSTDSIALAILENVLELLGEDQSKGSNLFLKSRSVDVDEFKIDKYNTKYFRIHRSTKDKLLDQREILERAVHIADIMRFPQRSVLVIEGMPPEFRHFSEMYHALRFADVKEANESKPDGPWLVSKSFSVMNPLWTWFDSNKDILFRVSFQLARSSVENIVRRLVKMRPSTEIQRHATMYKQDFERLGIRQNSEDDIEAVIKEEDLVSDHPEKQKKGKKGGIKDALPVRKKFHSESSTREEQAPKSDHLMALADREPRPYAAISQNNIYKAPYSTDLDSEERHTKHHPEKKMYPVVEEASEAYTEQGAKSSHQKHQERAPLQTQPKVPLPTSMQNHPPSPPIPPERSHHPSISRSSAATEPLNSSQRQESRRHTAYYRGPKSEQAAPVPRQPPLPVIDPTLYYARKPEWVREEPKHRSQAWSEYTRREDDSEFDT